MIGWWRLWAVMGAAVLLGCSGPSAAQADKAATAAARGPVLLVGNKGEDTVSFVELSSGAELARVPTGRMPTIRSPVCRRCPPII